MSHISYKFYQFEILSLIIVQVIEICEINYRKRCFSALGLSLYLFVVVFENIGIDPSHCIGSMILIIHP